MKKVKISELPLHSSLAGLYTIGTDDKNQSVKVSLEFVETETAAAIQRTQEATDEAVKNAEEATAAAKQAKTEADTATDAAKTATTNANMATLRAKEAAEKADTATANADAATEKANTAADNADTATAAAKEATEQTLAAKAEAETATANADKATETANTAAADALTVKADILHTLQVLVPTALAVKYPQWITKGNLAEQKITAELTPEDAAKNVIYLSDNKAVTVDPFGRVSVVGTGKSTVHVIPTLNTQLAKTVIIEVGEPSLRMAATASMRLTSAGAMRLY